MRASDVPFNKMIGINDENGVVTLPIHDQHLNHLGTVHATAIYGLAEACSGQFILKKFGEEFPGALAVTRNGTIKYKSPAKQDLAAEVASSKPNLEQAKDQLRFKGAAKISVEVKVRSSNEIVAIAAFDWFLRYS